VITATCLNKIIRIPKTKFTYIISLILMACNCLGLGCYTCSPGDKNLIKDNRVHIFFCGTGIPTYNTQLIRSPACLAIIGKGNFFLFDAGEGAIQHLAFLNLPFPWLNNIFITHLHSDHFAGLGQVINASWMLGRKEPLNIYGPYGIDRVVNGFSQIYAADTMFRSISMNGKLDPELANGIAHTIRSSVAESSAVIYRDTNYKISAFLVDHTPVFPALGYKLQIQNCVITISGDTHITKNLAINSKGSDILINEAFSSQATKDIMATEAQDKTKLKFITTIYQYHSDTYELAKMAQTANVKNLVLTHLVPSINTSTVEKIQFVKGMDKYYSRPIFVADDDDEIELVFNSNGQCSFNGLKQHS